MSFWKVDSKLAIAQKSVSVPSENGLSYTENQKIVIKIDPSVEYFQPSESYVQFRLKLKLGGTAKGGVLVALADKFGLPIHAIGVGEQIDDLQPFDPEEFAAALTGLDVEG